MKASDIDLVIFFDPETTVLRDPSEAATMYTRIAQQLAKLLQERTADGYVHRVDYRHVIHALRRKPQALAGSVYRDGLFPRSEYAAAWAALSEALPRRDTCRRMVDLLWLAHDEVCEAELAALIAEGLAAGRLPDARDLKMRLEPRRRSLPADVPVALTDLASFDALLEMCA